MELKTENPTQSPPLAPEAAPSEQLLPEDNHFFNVMPQTRHPGAVVQPVVKVKEEAIAAKPPSELLQKANKYKFYMLGALAVLILASVAYYVIGKIGGSSYKPENLIIASPHITPTATSTSASISQLAGVNTPFAWQQKYFRNQVCADASICGDSADPDHDGLTNAQEYKLGTDPNNPDSDQDGLSDGDEITVFLTNPLNARTASNSKYTDADFVKNIYDITSDKKLTPDQLAAVNQRMNQFGLHEPTLLTLGVSILKNSYNFQGQIPAADSGNSANASSTPTTGTTTPTNSLNVDESVSAKQDRDAQRNDAITNLGIALVQYLQKTGHVPDTQDVGQMYSDVKPYLKIAVDPQDPINVSPYVYQYVPNAALTDFTLTFYSESVNQPIQKHAADSQSDMNDKQAKINDSQRENDLQSLQTALLLYSNDNISASQAYVFPTTAKYKTALVPKYIAQIPTDPKTKQDYTYQVSQTFDSFTLKAMFENPATGTTGFLCNQQGCQNY